MIAWLCVWVFLISLTGCGKQDTKADHMLRVGVVTYTPDDPFINAMTDIIKSNLKAKESNTMKVIVSVRSGKPARILKTHSQLIHQIHN